MRLIYCIARLCMYCYSGVVPGKLSFMSSFQLPKMYILLNTQLT